MATGPAPFALVTSGTAAATIVIPPGMPASATPIVLEAESGQIVAPMRVVTDASTAGGAYVDSPAGSATTGELRFTVTVDDDAEYTMEGLVKGMSSSADSFLVQVDDLDPFVWNFGGGWNWYPVTTGLAANNDLVVVQLALAAGTHEIVLRNREPGARIDTLRLLPINTQLQLTEAVNTLVEYIEKSTGVELPVITPSRLDEPGLPANRIFVGWAGPGADSAVATMLAGLDPDGYVISPNATTLTIVGPTPWGTRFGVYEVLERYLGVRWLLPGPDGEDVPTHTDVTVSQEGLRHEPSFFSRVLPYFFTANRPDAMDWLSEQDQIVWATRQRTHSRSNGDHNLANIFPTQVYADPTKSTYRPELYPIINGQQFVPAVGRVSGWQPRFDIQATVDIAIDYAVQYFDEHPGEPLLSLGVNDVGGFSETDLDPGPLDLLTADRNLLNSAERVSASESYYAWVNAVVTGVLAERPQYADKIFPVLAYDNVIDPPSFDLHPAVVPMVTRETHSWADPEVRPGLVDMLDGWSARTHHFGWYDYSSGTRYLVPRSSQHATAEALRYAHSKGMRYQHSDMVPAVVGEGPKTWVYAKLLWDLDADVDALTGEWCQRAVGRKAAPCLRQYFALWEDFWNTRVQQTGWWDYSHNRIYYEFALTDYLDATTLTDLQRCRLLIGHVRDLADTPARQARAELLYQAFRYYEANLLSYPRQLPAPAGAAAALTLAHEMDDTLDDRVQAAADRMVIEVEHDANPVLKQRIDHRRFNHNWSGFNGSEFWHLVDHVRDNESNGGAVTSLLTSLAPGGNRPAARLARLVLGTVDGSRPQLAPNPSFTNGTTTTAPPWQLLGAIERRTDVGRDGGPGLRLKPPNGVRQMGREEAIVRVIPITPGLFAYRIWYRVTSGTVARGQVSVRCHLFNAAGASIWVYQQPLRLVSASGTDWTWISLCEDIPTTVNGQAVKQLRLVASILGFEGEAEVYFDDVEVYAENDVTT